MSNIRWEDPPPRKQSGAPGLWMERLTPLLDHPGRWARVHDATSRAAATQTVGRLRGRGARALDRAVIPPGRWEFRAAGLPDGSGAIYARYLGPDDDEATL